MISVALCTYNGAQHIEEQLRSIIGQSCPPDEIVVCDDGSRDATMEIARRILTAWHGESRLEENEQNLGFSRNFQKAMSLCRGEIIFLSDQDDIWHKDKIAIMTEAMSVHPEAMLAVHDAILVDMERQVLEPSFWRYFVPSFRKEELDEGFYGRLFCGNVVQGCACTLRRELFEQAQPFPESACHDEWLTLAAIAEDSLLLVDQPLLEYRQGNNQIGALRPGLLQKMGKWLGNFRQAAHQQMQERRRRNAVLQAFSERYGRSLSLENHQALQDYLRFGGKRVGKIQSGDFRLLFEWKDYIRLYPAKMGMKILLKDLMILSFAHGDEEGKRV